MKQHVVGSIVFVLVCLGWGHHSIGEPRPAPRGELRIVDKHHANWISIVLNVFEHLVEVDKDGQVVPGLATRWRWIDDRTLEMPLRRGVTFHTGKPFDAESVKLNWEAQNALERPFMVGTFMNFQRGSRLEIVDPYTVRFVFPEPDGAALIKLSLLHMANQEFYDAFGWGETSW